MKVGMTPTPSTHVESLTYSHTMTNEGQRFADGFRQVVHLGGFHCEVDESALVAKPDHSVSSVEEATAELEPHLDAWSLRSELLTGAPINFKKTGHVVRDETGGRKIGVGLAAEVEIAAEVKAVITTSRLVVPGGPPISISEETERLLRLNGVS